MDHDIARLYDERGVRGVRPRFAMPFIPLGRRGAMTIRELAAALEVTHSAMSQTVSALRREGLVRSIPGADARTREVALTERAQQLLLPFLEAEWPATEQAVAELEGLWIATLAVTNTSLRRFTTAGQATDRRTTEVVQVD
jgi:DNA-binding MarR family transcriptional regulator